MNSVHSFLFGVYPYICLTVISFLAYCLPTANCPRGLRGSQGPRCRGFFFGLS